MEKSLVKNNNPLTKKRDSNIELYRIITMFFIVAHHYVVNSGLTLEGGPVISDPFSWRSIFLVLFGAWGKIGINCFVLITGYFMVNSNITAKKFAKLLGEVLFYNVIISSIFWITGYEPLTIKSLISSLVPITSVEQNFTATYLIFFLTIPFLNILIRNMNEKQHIRLLLVCSFTYILFGFVHRVTMNYVSWYMVLYLISSYIRLYPKKLFNSTKLTGGVSALCIIASAASVVFGAWTCAKFDKNLIFYFVTDSNTPLAVATGVSTFLFFKNIKLGYSKIINTISASTFGVLMIHANSDAMRKWLWQDLLDNVGMYSSKYMPLHAIGSVLAIFIICTLIDILRINLIEKAFFRLWDKYFNKLKLKFEECENKLCDVFKIAK